MPALLIVSSDPHAGEQIEALAVSRSIRVRHVSQPRVAEEWVSMQTFEAILVDSRYPDELPYKLLKLAWKYNPFALGGVFNLSGKVEDEWHAKLIGAYSFSGAKALDNIARVLDTLPSLGSLADKSGVLLVEDLDAPRDILQSYIEALGVPKVTAVSSVDEALAALAEHPDSFFCVITDINMPKRNGMELIKAIRDNALVNHLPVIVLTAYSTTDNLLECVKAGATGFLVKPPQKKSLRFELEKARRLVVSGQSPRICESDQADMLSDAITRLSVG